MTQENVVTKTASLINANINIFYKDWKRFSPPPPVSDAHEFELYRKVFLYNFDHSLLRTDRRCSTGDQKILYRPTYFIFVPELILNIHLSEGTNASRKTI